MKTLIVFYSRTGATRDVAQELAQRLNADIAEITCRCFGLWPLGYLRAGFDSVRGKLPPIDLPPIDFSSYDFVLVGAPIWTSYPALPVRKFFSTATRLGAETGLFFTYEGHSPIEAALDEVARLWPHEIKASVAINMKETDLGIRSQAIADFVSEVCKENPPAI